MRNGILFFLMALLSHTLVLADVTPPTVQKSWFEKGIELFEKQKLDEAVTAFSQAEGEMADNPAILFNLGLTYFKLKKLGYAIAYWRRAQYVDPNFAPAKAALNYTLSQQPPKELPHEIELWESLHQKFLKSTHLNTLLALTALFLLIGGWLGIRYLGRRKTATLEELPRPPLPISAVLSWVALAIVLVVTLLKSIDETIVRGTITANQVTVRTGPAELSAELFDLFEGMEVVIRQTHEKWVQITYPGSYTGWIKESDILHTSGKQLW